ncbi:MAG TPA: site-specific integrase, partial [Candidatus Saccharimonadales bacterium]|nr:site-specific integrase [Candidatus Saccharimonadales bacterium]
IYVKRFKRPKRPRYGTLNMVFSEQELSLFLSSIKNRKFVLLFKYQAFLGLRIGEACVVNTNDMNFNTRELKINSEKSHVTDTLLIPETLLRDTEEYIRENRSAIEKSGGYLFFKDNDNNSNRITHIDKNYARKVFRKVREHAGLNEFYGKSEENYEGHPERPLYRLSTHSLRRYAITRFHHVSRDIVLTSRYARHQDTKQTIRYIENNRDELYSNIDIAFNKGVQQRKASPIYIDA